MRLKPRVWFLVSLLLFAAAICMWQHAEKYGAVRRAEANRAAAAKAGLQHPPAANALATNAVAKRKSYRISNTTQTIAQLLHNSHALILRNALIDTEVPVALNIPSHLRAKGAPGSYLVQADRPLDKAFYAELSRAGAVYLSYVPNNAALVQASPQVATNIAANGDVVAVLPYEPYYKLDGALLPSAVEQQPQTNTLSVTTFPGQRDAALAALTQLGAKLVGEDRSPFGPTLIVRVPPESLVAVAQLPLAQEIEAVAPRHLLNDLTRVQMGVAVNALLGTPSYLNLTGSNVTVSINDTGVDSNHPDFGPPGRLIADPNNPGVLTDNSGHGTHVAGIIAGNGTQSSTVTNPVPGSIIPGADFRGKAINATLFVQVLNGYTSIGSGGNFLISDFYTSDSYLQENASSNLGPTNLISNNSWGYGIPAGETGTYDSHAASYDAATRDAQPNVDGEQPMLFVFAASDSGNGEGTIDSPATAKNVITVGASDSPRFITNIVTGSGEEFYSETANSNTVAPFSGCGNVDIGLEGTYGRFKPDVVAPGVFTISCRATDYVDPTNGVEVTEYPYPVQTLDLNETNDYSLFLPSDTSGLAIVISSNSASPTPFPTNLLILGDPFGPPTDILATNDSLSVSNYVPGSIWFFGVTPPATQPQPVACDINIYLYETNNTLSNYFYAVSNLNSVLKPWYVYQSGTSMSAGAVSGTLALMQQFLQMNTPFTNPSPALLKAMLINGSRTLGSQYDFNVNTEVANKQGWGLPNITNCIPSTLTNANTSMVLIDQSTNSELATGQYQTYIVNSNTAAMLHPLRITLVWTDPPGNPAAGVALVNNLNLTVADNTGTNILIGNNFQSGDIYTVVSNPNDLPSGQSDNDVENIYVNQGVATNTAAGDSINNVQNVYINPANTSIQYPLTVTVSGTRVNVNAATTQTNNILQDYALVISSDDQALASPLTVTTNGITTNNFPLITAVSNGVPLLHQRVGANEPNIYNYTNGMTNGALSQWHFFIFNNPSNNIATNVAFATFLPPNLSIPRNSSADIDLYVFTTNPPLASFADFLLTDFPANFEAFANGASKSVGRTGTQTVTFTNATNQFYYIGVKSEDQQAADFGLYAVAQQAPFGSLNADGSITAYGTSLPVFIPNAITPTPALIFAFMVNPNPTLPYIRRVVVTNGIQHGSPSELDGTLQFNGIDTVLNYYSGPTGGFTNAYDDLQEDPGSGDVITDGYANGTGGLTQYVGQPANGLWLLSEASDSLTQTGYDTTYSVTVNLQPPQTGGFVISDFCGGQYGQWFDDYINVPNDATNLIITATITSGTGPIYIYLANVDSLNTGDYGGATYDNVYPNGTSLSLSTNPPAPGLPPLVGGLWYYGIYNPPGGGCVNLDITNVIQESLTPNLVQTYTTNSLTPLTTDGHTQSQICITNGQQIVSLQVGVRIDDTNLDDLVLHLTSPQGTTVDLFEDRGGLLATNLGLTQITDGQTNYIYTVFTENTNLTTTPIKFAPPPFASNSFTLATNLSSNSFETASSEVYTTGAVLEGWLVTNNVITVVSTNGPVYLTNDEVGIVTDTNGDQIGATSLGVNFLALTSGHILQTFGATNTFSITNGLPYQFQFYAKPLGIIDWWPGDNNAEDIIGTNDGIAINMLYDAGEVGRAFTFDGVDSEVSFGTNAGVFGTNEFSIDFWIKTPPTNVTVALLEKGCASPSNYFELELINGNIAYNDISNVFQGTSNVADLFYHHVALTRLGSMVSIYVDGALDSSNVAPGIADLDDTNGLGLVAGMSECGAAPFSGDLDELDLFNRALSPAEIYAIYNAGSLGKYSTNSLLPNFQVAIDGITTNTIILPSASENWQLFTNSFVANSDQVTIEFTGNTLGVLLDDIQLIQLSATNYDNYYLPEEPLTPFVGENPLGCWTLDVWDTRQDSTNSTNGTLLSWTMQVTTSSTNAALNVLTMATNDTITTNASTNEIVYFAIDVPSYANYATNILTVTSGGPLTLLFDQTALPTGGLPGDVVLMSGVNVGTSNVVLATEGGLPPLLPGQRYFLGVLTTGTDATFTLTVDFNVAASPTNVTPLTDAVAIPTNITGTSSPQYYSFVVPTDATMVTFQITNVSGGEVDLFARDGLPLPGPSIFDYQSRNAGSNDQFIVVTTNSVPVPLPLANNDVLPLTPSTWYLAAYATANVTYSIVATAVTSGGITVIPLTNATAYISGIAPPGYSTTFYSYTASDSPAGIQFTVTNLTQAGNVELLDDLNTFPTPEQFYSGSFEPGTNVQFVQIGTNSAMTNLNGTWYLAVPNTTNITIDYSIEATELYNGPLTNAPAFLRGSITSPSGGFTMYWSASPGQTYAIDVSTNLAGWTNVTNITTQSTIGSYTDPTPVESQTARFYRLQKK